MGPTQAVGHIGRQVDDPGEATVTQRPDNGESVESFRCRRQTIRGALPDIHQDVFHVYTGTWTWKCFSSLC